MTGGNRSCKQGKSVEQAKVFKAHAIPQGLCEHLINALKLLASKQEDGDGLPQNTVTNLGKGSRKGLTDGLRDFIKVAPWMLESYTEARELLKFGSRKFRKEGRILQ